MVVLYNSPNLSLGGIIWRKIPCLETKTNIQAFPLPLLVELPISSFEKHSRSQMILLLVGLPSVTFCMSATILLIPLKTLILEPKQIVQVVWHIECLLIV